MNQKATDLHDEFKIDHQVFLAHFQRLDLSNAKLEKKSEMSLKQTCQIRQFIGLGQVKKRRFH